MYLTFSVIIAEYHITSNTNSVPVVSLNYVIPKRLCLARLNSVMRRSLLSIPGHNRNGSSISPVHVQLPNPTHEKLS